MVTCERPPLTMLPMVPINPFVVALKTSPSVPAASTTTINTISTTNITKTTTESAASAKPKLAFSIDALVGGERQPHNVEKRCPSPRSPLKCSTHHVPNSISFEHLASLELRNAQNRNDGFECSTKERCAAQSASEVLTKKLTPHTGRECKSPYCDRSQSPALLHSSRSPTPLQSPHEHPSPEEHLIQLQHKTSLNLPNLPTGLVRPFPLQAPPPPPSQPSLGLIRSLTSSSDSNATAHAPSSSHLVASGLQHPALPPPGATANPHLLAAQFQMAAVLAHHQQQQQQQQHQHQTGLGPPPPPPPPHSHITHAHHLGLFPSGPHHPHHPAFGNPHLIRDTYPLYPWLLSRHGRIFSHRFPGFLLQPFRKPKRVRTAFSPTQLLKLEHAFEENHYVVGAERKQLAQGLSLTETQVKVWFQNRRTKHKRMQQESDSDSKSQKGSTSGDNEAKCDGSQTSFDDDQDELDDDVIDETEDEVIDMDDYDEQQHEHDRDIIINAEERQRMTEHLQEMHNRHFTHNQMIHQQQQQQQHQHLLQHHQHYLLQQHQQQQHQQQQQFHTQSDQQHRESSDCHRKH